MSRVTVWRVVLDMPLRRPFDYLPPQKEAGKPIRPGIRVRVPFGRQRLIGVVTEKAATSDIAPERLKPILEVLDTEPVLDAAMLALLKWAAEYYHHPIGEVLAAALPKALRLGAPASATRTRWVVSAAGRTAQLAGEPRRAPRQRELLLHLIEKQGCSAEELAVLGGNVRAHLRSLGSRGWVSAVDAPASVAARPAGSDAQGFALNSEQEAAVSAIGATLESFGAFLLHGITGSGKTFVYISAMGADSTARGRVMWARVRGETENALFALPFKGVYALRPGLIQPLHGITSRTAAYRFFYAVLAPLIPLVLRLFPNQATTTERLGRAMLQVAKSGAPKQVLETRDFNALS